MNTNPINGWQSASVSADTLSFYVSSLPSNTTVIICQGATGMQAGVPFGGGVRCIGGSMIRLGTTHASPQGDCDFPLPGAPSVSVRGAVPPIGGYRSYQAMFRVAQQTCGVGTFNASNAIGVLWTP